MKNLSGACPVKVFGVATDPSNRADQLQQHLDSTFDDVLEESIVDLVEHISIAQAELAVRIGEFDRREIAEVQHHLSTTQWLKHHTRMTGAEASGSVKTGRVLAHMPTIVDKALVGEVPQRSLQLLAQARDKHPEEFSDHEHVFADIATYLSVEDLRRAISHWDQQVNYDQALTDTKKLDQQRGLFHSQTFDGLWATQGTFTPEGGHIIKQAINGICDPQNLDAGELRSPSQRRADAMVDICSFWLNRNTDAVTSAGEKPHVTITLDYEILAGRLKQLPEIDGAFVTPATMRRMTCDAAIIPMVLGSEGEPLDVGRKTRTIKPALRRAIEKRDKHCTWHGCFAPASWCDVHHDKHWADGGETSLANCRLLCRKHHTATHNLEDDTPPRSQPKPISIRDNRSPPDT